MANSLMMRRLSIALAAACFLRTWPSFLPASLALSQRGELPWFPGRIVHLDINLDGNRPFVAALGAGSVKVLDLQAAGKRIARFVLAPHLSALFMTVPSRGESHAQIRA